MKILIHFILVVMIFYSAITNMYSIDSRAEYLKVFDAPVKYDTITLVSTFETCIVEDTVKFDKLYTLMKEVIINDDSLYWSDSKAISLNFKKINSKEYNITIYFSFEGILNRSKDLFCKYKEKVFLLRGDIPSYFKKGKKIIIENKVIRPIGIHDKLYIFKYKNENFYQCDYDYNIMK